MLKAPEMRLYRKFAVLLLSYTVTIIVCSFTYVDNPWIRKKSIADNNRINALNSIRSQIDTYAYTNNKLPNTLEDIDLNTSIYDVFIDRKVEYKVVGEKFELCTEFQTSNLRKKDYSSMNYDFNYMDDYSDPYSHDKGYYCVKYNNPIAYQSKQLPQTPQNLDDIYSTKGDSDPKLDKTISGPLQSKYYNEQYTNPMDDNGYLISLSVVNENYVPSSTPNYGDYYDPDNQMYTTFSLDQNTKVYSSLTGEIIPTSELHVLDQVEIVYGKTTNGSNYARTITKIITETD